MNAPSLRGNTLCLAVAAVLAVSLAPMAAVAAETVIIRDAELEFIQPVTYGHAEIYDSRVINHASGSGAGREAVRIDRGNLRMERTEVVTRGDEMSALSYYGAEYYNNGVVYDAVIVDSDFRTSGDKAVGLLFSSTTFDSSTGALDKVGQITVQGSTVSTTGVQSHAMGVAGVNAVDVTGTQFTTAGQGAAGVSMMGGILAMREGSSVANTGDGAHGIHARSMRWSTSGRPGVVYRADVTLVDSTVTTFGAGSVGILAGYQDNGTPVGIGARLRLQHAGVRSAQSHAVQFLRGQDNTLDLGAGSVLDGGDAVVFAGEADSISRVTATDSSLIGRGAQALVADNGARLDVQLDNSDVQVAGGMGLAHARNGGAIDIHATGSRLQGSVQADEGASLAVQLDSSRWNAWGPSQLDQLSLRNGSVLALGAGSVGDRLIVRGDLRIDDSTLAFDSALGDDGSPTDHLWVKGDTAGRGAVVVNNAGGRGGQTVDGIQLIRVDGQSAAALTLAGRAVGGSTSNSCSRAATAIRLTATGTCARNCSRRPIRARPIPRRMAAPRRRRTLAWLTPACRNASTRRWNRSCVRSRKPVPHRSPCFARSPAPTWPTSARQYRCSLRRRRIVMRRAAAASAAHGRWSAAVAPATVPLPINCMCVGTARRSRWARMYWTGGRSVAANWG